jgi:hypothetical protein
VPGFLPGSLWTACIVKLGKSLEESMNNLESCINMQESRGFGILDEKS